MVDMRMVDVAIIRWLTSLRIARSRNRLFQKHDVSLVASGNWIGGAGIDVLTIGADERLRHDLKDLLYEDYFDLDRLVLELRLSLCSQSLIQVLEGSK